MGETKIDSGRFVQSIQRAKRHLALAAACGAALGAVRHAAAATDTWTGGAGVGATNWSNPNNFSGGVPTNTSDVVFPSNGGGLVFNTVDQNFTINSLDFINTVGTYTTQVADGATLTITGTSTGPGLGQSAAFYIGGVKGTTTALNTGVTFTGTAGAVVVTSPNLSANLIITNDTSSNRSNQASLDMSGLGSFTFNGANIGVGISTTGIKNGVESGGTLILADTNVITTASGTNIAGDSKSDGIVIGNTNANDQSVFKLGRVNTINTDFIGVGVRAASATMSFNNAGNGSTLILRGHDGTSRVGLVNVGDFSSSTTSSTPGVSAIDLTGGSVDAMIGTLNIGIGDVGNAHPQLASFSFGVGTLDVTTLNVGTTASTTTASGASTGTLNVSGGTVITSALTLGKGASATGILNVSGGTINLTAGDLANGGGLGAALNMSGGTLDLKPAGRSIAGNIGGATTPISLTLDAGSIAHVNNIWTSSFSGAGSIASIANLSGTLTANNSGNASFAGTIGGAGSLVVGGGGALILTNAQTYTGPTTVNAGSTLALGAGASLASSAIFADGVLDVTGLGSLSISGAGHQLGGAGLITGGPVTIGNGAALTPGRIGTAGTLSIGGDLNFTGNNTLNFDINGSDTTRGSGINDFINVSGNLSLSGITNVSLGVLGTSLTNGTYGLISYGGSLIGGTANLSINNQTRRSFVFSSAANEIDLTISGSATPVALAWLGNVAGHNWDVNSSQNWTNGTSLDKFFNLDGVTFDARGTANSNVNLVGSLQPGNVTVDTTAGNYTFSGSGGIAGGAGLTKSGPGTLTINNSGGNSFSGGTTINAGVIQIGSNGATVNELGSGAVAILPGASLALNAPGSYMFNTPISNAGLMDIMSGSVTLATDNPNFSGTIRVESGATLLLSGPSTSTLGQGSTTRIVSGGTLDLANATQDSTNLAAGNAVFVSGAGVGGNGAIVNSGGFTQKNALQSVTLEGDTTFGGASTWAITGGGSGLSTGGNAYNLTIAMANNAAAVQLNGINVDGALANVTITRGVLALLNGSGLGDTTVSKVTINPTGTLALGGSNNFAKPIALAGGSVQSSGGGNVITGPINVTADNSGISASDNFGISGNISGSNSLNVGGGTVHLSGDNSGFTGTMNIVGSQVVIDAETSTALGSGTSGGVVLNRTSSTGGFPGNALNLVGGVNIPARPLTMSSQGSADFRSTLQSLSGGDNSYAGPITLQGDGNFDLYATAGTLTVSGSITNSSTNVGNTNVGLILAGVSQGFLTGVVNDGVNAVSKFDAGTWTISSPGSTWGVLKVKNGTVLLGADNALATGGSVLMGQGSTGPTAIGTLDLNGFNQTIAGLANEPASTTVAGQVVTDSGVPSTLTLNVSVPSTYQGMLTGSLGLTVAGSSTFTLSGIANSYTGPTTVNSGVLQAGAVNVLPLTTSLALGTATSGGTLDLNGFSQTVGEFSGSSGSLVALGGATMTVGDSSSMVYGGNIADAGGVSAGTGGTLLKVGSGTLLLARATGLTLPNLNVGAGAVNVGSIAGTATGPLIVPGTLNVADTAQVTLSPSTTGVGTNSGVVHSINNLNLNNTGILDLGNTAVSVGAATPIATIRQYLTTGYSNGNWNGTSGGGITSTWAANDATHRTAVGYAAQPDGTTLVAATLYGDTTLKGSVGLSDYNTLAANFNKPGVWAQGDFDYDGTVTLADYNKLATNFNKSAQPGGGVAAAGAGAAAKAASVTLTGSASPAASVLPDGVVDPGAGNVVLEANPSTGQLYLVGHDSNINSYEVDSAAGKLTFVSQKNHGGYNTLTAQSGSTGLPGSALGQNEDIWATISSAAGTFVAEAYPAGSNPAFDTFGPGLQVFDLNVSGLSAWTAGTPISDLTFKYGNGTGNTLTPAVIPIGVPEPTCLALAGIAAGGLLSRRRRRIS